MKKNRRKWFFDEGTTSWQFFTLCSEKGITVPAVAIYCARALTKALKGTGCGEKLRQCFVKFTSPI